MATAIVDPQTPIAADVYRAISQVQKAISKDGIAKGRKNQQQGYGFRGIDDIYNSLSGLLAAADLCILPRMTDRTQEERPTQKGGVLFYVTVRGDFDFVSARDGSRHTVTMFGEGMDSADKATNKAMSAAFKYACLQVFCIPTEGMPDADATTPEPGPKLVKPQPAAQMAERIPDEQTGSYTYEEEVEMSLEEKLEMALEAERQRRFQSFTELQRKYTSLGFARTYDAILALHGVCHASEFPDTEEGISEARKCYREMAGDLAARQKKVTR